MKKMKKNAIKSSISAFFLTLLVDVIVSVVTLGVFDVPSRIVSLYTMDLIYLEDGVPPDTEPFFLPYVLWGSLLVFLIVLYFPPTFFAYRNKVRARRWILLCNVLLGWTIVGWFVCFFWAFSLNRDSRPDRDSDRDSDRDERSQKAEQE